MTKPQDIIIFRLQEEKQYNRLLLRAVQYALLSVPFTINRMALSGLKPRIINIAKGKLAELLLAEFFRKYRIEANFEQTQTPYWLTDKNDFLFNGYEWDVKNNFIFCERYSRRQIPYFLALIPNRNETDQWSKRSEVYFPDLAPKGKAFLFTFMRKPRQGDLFVLWLSSQMLEFLKSEMDKHHGIPAQERPIDFERRFKQIFTKEHVRVKPKLRSELIITSYATSAEFELFRDCPKGTRFTKYNKCFVSRIENKCVRIGRLPAFKSMIFKNRTK